MKVRRTVLDAEQARTDLLRGLQEKGITLPESDVQFLEKNNLAQVSVSENVDKPEEKTEVVFRWETLFRNDKVVSPVEFEADKRVAIVEPHRKLREKMLVNGRILMKDFYEDELKQCSTFHGQNTKITKADWMPEELDIHTPEFKAWIDSISQPEGFLNTTYYHRFHLYVQQARQWEREYQPPEMEEKAWRRREMERCRENSLFGLNRYLELKEASVSGMKKYVATKAHEIILYLLDCGYSMNIAKARQIAFTTTICGWSMLNTMYNRDYIIKYISEDVPKAEATIADKLKYPFGKLSKWMRPHVDNDWLGGLFFGKKESKGVVTGNHSIVEVVAPTQTPTASSTPTVTLVDERGQIDNNQKIESDTEPTLYGFNPKTGLQQLMRMFVGWGTGGEMRGKAGVGFKNSYADTLKKWKAGGRVFMIPLFFNTWWRPGMTMALYDQLYKEAYSAEGSDAEVKRIRFHQSYPIKLDDVFKIGGTKLVSDEWLDKRVKDIEAKGAQAAVTYGYFEPIYDTSKPAEEGSDVPFKITGANFVPCEQDDPAVTAIILDNRRPWRNRYYQGTDPISSKSGLSEIASVIWDAHWSTPVAVVHCRHQGNPHKDFLQVMLMGLYYDIEGKGGVKELIEANIGTTYEEYKRNKGYGKSLVWESELPPSLQTRGNTTLIGVDNKGLRNDLIIGYMRNIFLTFGNNIWISIFFEQLNTFVEKIKDTLQATVTWEPIDKRLNRDDTLFALTYAYICSQCYTTRKPEPIETTSSTKTVIKHRPVRQPDGSVVVKPVRIKKQVIRPDYARR